MFRLVLLLFLSVLLPPPRLAVSSPPPAGALQKFLSCVDASTPVHTAGSSEFPSLLNRNFRNGRATPLVVVTAETVNHVRDAVRCAGSAGIGVCARSGGHSLVGKSLCQGALVDVGLMRQVRLVEGGTTNRVVRRAAEEEGLSGQKAGRVEDKGLNGVIRQVLDDKGPGRVKREQADKEALSLWQSRLVEGRRINGWNGQVAGEQGRSQREVEDQRTDGLSGWQAGLVGDDEITELEGKVSERQGGSGAKRMVAEVGAGVTMGELLWKLWNDGSRWVAAGVCPGVGVGGYIFGGGHGPYEGRLGMACDSLEEVTMVDWQGNVTVASREKESELFWGLCGAGGGQFGIITSFKIRTVDSTPFDRAVVFRFNWNQQFIGQLMQKWMDYDEMGGDVWFRMEMYLARGGESGMFGYGACYDVSSVEECMGRLNKSDFFNTPGRNLTYIGKAKNALDAHAFFGPEGGWGRTQASNLERAMLERRYSDVNAANNRIYQSTFLKKGSSNRPTAEFWQKYADFCANPGRPGIPWIVCELNLFNNAIDRPQNNAFPHRDADIITHYIVGGGSEADKMFVYNWMKNHLAPYTSGVFVSYPELELGPEEYPRAYWGKSLGRLQLLKGKWDPEGLFLNPQPIPAARKTVVELVTLWERIFRSSPSSN